MNHPPSPPPSSPDTPPPTPHDPNAAAGADAGAGNAPPSPTPPHAPVAPPEATGLAAAQVGAAGVVVAPLDSTDRTEFITRRKDTDPTLIDRIKALVADGVLHGFLALCIAYIYFNFTRDLGQPTKLEAFLRDWWGHVGLIGGIGAGVGLAFNALNLSWTAHVFGFSRRPDTLQHGYTALLWTALLSGAGAAFGYFFVDPGPIVGASVGAGFGLWLSFPTRQRIAKAAQGRPGNVLLTPRFASGFVAIMLTLWAGWYVTAIKIAPLLNEERRERMTGVIGRFLNVFGMESVDTLAVPPHTVIPFDALQPLSPLWDLKTQPEGSGDALSRVQFFSARRPGTFELRRLDDTGTITDDRVTIRVELGAPMSVDANGRLQPIAPTTAGVYRIPPRAQVPMGQLAGLAPGMWQLATAPADAPDPLSFRQSFTPSGIGDYLFVERPKKSMYSDDVELPGRRAIVRVRADAVLPTDAETRRIVQLNVKPEWTRVEQTPRAWGRFAGAVPSMIETVFLALMATVLAVPLAFVVSFFGAQNLMCTSKLGTLIYYFTRSVMNLIRSIEPLCWAIIFSVWVSVGTFPGVLALMVHTIASLAKLYSEQIESIDSGPVEAIQATGASTLQVVRHAIVPQVIPPFISYTMYRWDINVRMAPILGFVGGGGIGVILSEHFNRNEWEEVGVIILLITIVVAAMDFTSAKIRARLV